MLRRFLCGLLIAATIITSLPGAYISGAAEIDAATVSENVATEGEDLFRQNISAVTGKS